MPTIISRLAAEPAKIVIRAHPTRLGWLDPGGGRGMVFGVWLSAHWLNPAGWPATLADLPDEFCLWKNGPFLVRFQAWTLGPEKDAKPVSVGVEPIGLGVLRDVLHRGWVRAGAVGRNEDSTRDVLVKQFEEALDRRLGWGQSKDLAGKFPAHWRAACSGRFPDPKKDEPDPEESPALDALNWRIPSMLAGAATDVAPRPQALCLSFALRVMVPDGHTAESVLLLPDFEHNDAGPLSGHKHDKLAANGSTFWAEAGYGKVFQADVDERAWTVPLIRPNAAAEAAAAAAAAAKAAEAGADPAAAAAAAANPHPQVHLTTTPVAIKATNTGAPTKDARPPVGLDLKSFWIQLPKKAHDHNWIADLAPAARHALDPFGLVDDLLAESRWNPDPLKGFYLHANPDDQAEIASGGPAGELVAFLQAAIWRWVSAAIRPGLDQRSVLDRVAEACGMDRHPDWIKQRKDILDAAPAAEPAQPEKGGKLLSDAWRKRGDSERALAIFLLTKDFKDAGTPGNAPRLSDQVVGLLSALGNPEEPLLPLMVSEYLGGQASNSSVLRGVSDDRIYTPLLALHKDGLLFAALADAVLQPHWKKLCEFGPGSAQIRESFEGRAKLLAKAMFAALRAAPKPPRSLLDVPYKSMTFLEWSIDQRLSSAVAGLPSTQSASKPTPTAHAIAVAILPVALDAGDAAAEPEAGASNAAPEAKQEAGRDDPLRRLSGVGVLFRQQGNPWRVLNAVSLSELKPWELQKKMAVEAENNKRPVQVEAEQLLIDTVAPLRLGYSADLRTSVLEYDNGPIVGADPRQSASEPKPEGAAGNDDKLLDESDLEGSRGVFTYAPSLFRNSNDERLNAETARLEPLRFGITYEIAAFGIDASGALPKGLARFDSDDLDSPVWQLIKPWRPIRVPSEHNIDSVSVPYFRRVPVGACSLASDSDTSGGRRGPAGGIPPWPAGVRPVASERTVESLGIAAASLQRVRDRQSSSVMEEPLVGARPPLVVLTPAQPSGWMGPRLNAVSTVEFELRPPSVDFRTWDRWVRDGETLWAGGGPGVDKALREEVLSAFLADQDALLDPSEGALTIDDPAVIGIEVEVADVSTPLREGDEPPLYTDYHPLPNTADRPRAEVTANWPRRMPFGITLNWEESGSPKLIGAANASRLRYVINLPARPVHVNNRIQGPAIYRVSVYPVVENPPPGKNRFQDELKPEFFKPAIKAEGCWRTQTPWRLLVECIPKPPTVADNRDDRPHPSLPAPSAAFKRFIVESVGAEVRASLRFPSLAEADEFVYVKELRAEVQGWRWRGRPQRGDFAGAQLLKTLNEARNSPEDHLLQAKLLDEALAWELANMADRSDADARIAVAERSIDHLQTRIYTEDFRDSTAGVYLRLGLKLAHRYGPWAWSASSEPDTDGIQWAVQAGYSLDKGTGIGTGKDKDRTMRRKRFYLPCRRLAQLPPPKVKMVVPLTRAKPLGDDRPAGDAPVATEAPSVLVVLDEPWYEAAGPGESFNAEIEQVRVYDRQSHEFGPDPIVTGDAHAQDAANAAKPTLEIVGPLGHSFQEPGSLEERVNASSFIVQLGFTAAKPVADDLTQPPAGDGAKPPPDDPTCSSWWMAKLCFQRKLLPGAGLGEEEALASDRTPGRWVQFLPNWSEPIPGVKIKSIVRDESSGSGNQESSHRLEFDKEAEVDSTIKAARDRGFQLWVLLTSSIRSAGDRPEEGGFLAAFALRERHEPVFSGTLPASGRDVFARIVTVQRWEAHHKWHKDRRSPGSDAQVDRSPTIFEVLFGPANAPPMDALGRIVAMTPRVSIPISGRRD